MNTKFFITLDNHQIYLIFDYGGNLYFKYQSSNDIYDLNIDLDNNISLSKNDIIIINNDDTNKPIFGKIIRTKLKEKITENHENDKNDENNENDDENINEKDDYLEYKYENNEYINHDYQENLSEEHEYVKFLSSSDQFNIDIININNEIDDIALYDTIIYNKNNDICYITEMYGFNTPYRIKIYETGIISFRAIGFNEKLYKLKYDNESNNLSLEYF